MKKKPSIYDMFLGKWSSPEYQEMLRQASDNLKRIVEHIKIEAEKYNKWITEQNKRYPEVKEAVEAYLKSKGRILPTDFRAFLLW